MVKKIAVVTSLMGAYDKQLLEFDYNKEEYDFICYTNIKRLKSDTWDIRYVEEMPVPEDNARSSYYYKWNPHKYLDKRKYDTFVWMDSSFTMIAMDEISNMLFDFKNNGTALYIEKHPGRNTLRGELDANTRLNKDNTENMSRQVERYFADGYNDKYTTMVETGLSFRKFKDKDLIALSEHIWAEISPLENTKRDQLVYDYCVWKHKFTDVSLFTYQEKCKAIIFSDHPNKATHSEKVLLVGPWLGEVKYEKMWAKYVEDYLHTDIHDRVIVGCRPGRNFIYKNINPDRFVITNPKGHLFKHTIDGSVPRFNVKVNSNPDVVVTELLSNEKWYEHNEYHITTDNVVFTGNCNVYYNYYIDKDGLRDEELKFSLKALISNPEIDNVYLVIDSINDAYPSINSDKVKFIRTNYRPSYSNMFTMVNERTGDGDINIIINSDCFFSEEGVRDIKDNLAMDECWVLSRKELLDKNSLTWVGRINDAGSQDAWVFKGEVKPIDAKFTMGRMGCDNKIALLIKEAGYTVLNPSKDVILYHNHATEKRNYNINNKIPPPYLLVNSCYSYDKVEDNAVIESDFMVNPYLTEHYVDEEFFVSSVVTSNVLQEFLLFRMSMSQYHKNCKWILSTDQETSDVLSTDGFEDIDCHVLVEEQGSHRFGDAEQDRKFKQLVMTKLEICRISMERHGYAFLMDTDMVMLSEFNKIFFDFLKNSAVDVCASHHHLQDKVLETRVGKYNVGMVIIRDPKFIDEWESNVSDELFFEQKPFEITVENGDYIFGELGNNLNVAYWRMENNNRLTFTIKDKRVCINGDPIVNAHVHMISDNSTTKDFSNNRHKDVLMSFIGNSTNPKHQELYKKIKELNNGNN